MDRDEAIKVIRDYYPSSGKDLNEALETLIPELKESEDERIRKELIEQVVYIVPNDDEIDSEGNVLPTHQKRIDKYLAWLEKQGEQSSLNTNKECLKGIKRVQEYQELSDWEKKFDDIASRYAHNKNQEGYNSSWYVRERAAEMLHHAKKELEKQGLQNLANSAKTCKDEPKFKVGDWVINTITNPNEVEQVIELTGCEYICSGHLIISFNNQHLLKRWTIQDAKDGDVLLFEGYYNSIVLFQGIGINGKGRINYHCKCDLGNYSFGVQGDVACLGTIEKDAEHYHPATKEQRDLLFQKMKEAGYEWDAEKKEMKKIEQNPTWSEEDEERLDSIIESYKFLLRDYKACHDVELIPYDSCTVVRTVVNDVNFLKSLKERYTWKTSEQQIGDLEYIMKYYPNIRGMVNSIYNDLKKLTE